MSDARAAAVDIVEIGKSEGVSKLVAEHTDLNLRLAVARDPVLKESISALSFRTRSGLSR